MSSRENVLSWGEAATDATGPQFATANVIKAAATTKLSSRIECTIGSFRARPVRYRKMRGRLVRVPRRSSSDTCEASSGKMFSRSVRLLSRMVWAT